MKTLIESQSMKLSTLTDVSRNLQHLQDSGSFRNALIKSFDAALIPIFSGIIAFIDQYSNLELLTPQIDFENDKPAPKLWLELYSSNQVCDTILHLKVPHYTTSNFKCSFPFSWIIFHYIESKVKEDSGKLSSWAFFFDFIARI